MTSQVVPMPNPREGSQLAARTSRADPALPSILGMYAFAAATFIVAAHMAHWLGNAQSAIVVFPLVLFVGGLAQFYASTWAFRTGDGIALAMHGIWGSFWTAYGLLELLYATGYAVRPETGFPELGFWFIAIAAITWGIVAASRHNKSVTTLLTLLALGSTLEAIGELAGVDWLRMLAGYFMMASALVAWYVATTVMLHLGKTVKAQPSTQIAESESVHAA